MPVKIYTLSNPSAGKMKVSYDYRPGGSGYVVRYGLNSDMSGAKVITVKGGRNNRKDIWRDEERKDILRAGKDRSVSNRRRFLHKMILNKVSGCISDAPAVF